MTQQNLSNVAAQLDAFVRANPTPEQVEEGLRALGYRKGTPGYRAVQEPVTPVDKAFQIYSLSLSLLCNFSHEPYQHEALWSVRDKAWALAAEWLIATEEPFKSTPKGELRALKKELPEALRMQCSHELPPGPWETFPKDRMRQSKERQVLTDTLQHMGMNRKIRAMEVLEPSTISWAAPAVPLRDFGTLESIMDMSRAVNEKNSTQLMPQPSLF